VAEWLRNGLQNRVHQFNSGRGLHQHNQVLPYNFQVLPYNFKEIASGRLWPLRRLGKPPGQAASAAESDGFAKRPIGQRPETCMENFALQRGPTAVLSTERSPPNLAAAFTRLRRSFWLSYADRLKAFDSHGVDFARSLDVSIKSQLAGLFQGFEAFDTSRQLARRFKCGLSRLPRQVGVTRVLCWHGIFHRSLRMVTGTGYRRKLRSFETSGNKKT
jgi:hypothetical protein